MIVTGVDDTLLLDPTNIYIDNEVELSENIEDNFVLLLEKNPKKRSIKHRVLPNGQKSQ